VASSRIGTALRAARERAGWSREALAYHSGVSWSAIAQIESGRRKDVRLSSLSALADALHVSVDYLVGGKASTSPTKLLGHGLLIYGSDEELAGSATRFLAEGIERSERLLAVMAEQQLELLHDALGDDARFVEFREASDWYRSPSEATNGYRRLVNERFESAGQWTRIVGELALAGRSKAEVEAWTRYESMINLALASSPATILCVYDTRSLPAEVIADARRTHPELTRGAEAVASSDYRAPEDFLLNRSRSSDT
jgi:transcriptional regulator with XRE-family HTH domain